MKVMVVEQKVLQRMDITKNRSVLIGAAVLVLLFLYIRTSAIYGDISDYSRMITIGELADLIADPDSRADINLIVVGPRDEVQVYTQSGSTYKTQKDPNSSLPSQLRSMAISDSVIEDIRARIEVRNMPYDNLPIILINFAPLLLIGLLFWFWYRRNNSGVTKNVISMKASPVVEQKGFREITFQHIGGYEPAKQEFKDLINLLIDTESRQKRDIRLPSGVLLTGAAGTGKSRLAQAVAGETGLTLVRSGGSDLMDMFIGVGAHRIADLFKKARDNAPSVLIIDNLDMIGFSRTDRSSNTQDERLQTFSALLNELDNFPANQNILVIGICNRPELLDDSLIRAGRLEHHIHLNLPDETEREAILRQHIAGHSLDSNVDLKSVAQRSAGLVGADLERLINEADISSLKAVREQITTQDMDVALNVVRPASSQ